MGEETGIALASIFLLGIGAQWVAWRVRLPAILLLLIVGLVAGPATGFLKPDEVFGPSLLLPIVSLSVAVILFEGGLNLKFQEVKKLGGTVVSLVTVGMVVSWMVGAVAARLILGFSWSLALLIGGILVVTGPTVIGPLLRQIRPKKTVSSLLKWEGILIDPIGALLAVVMFEVTVAGIHGGTADVASVVIKTVLIGLFGGLALAALLVVFFRQFWIPDFLHSPFTLMVVLGAFTFSNIFQDESGLLTVTVLGIAMANQKFAKVEHILAFKENLQVLLISSLFILLAARIQMETLAKIGTHSLLYLLALVLIGRPLSVFVSTAFSKMELKEKLFVSLLAPRGIVAAAVASVFAIRLQEVGVEGADTLVPNVFFVIVGTVLIYGLGSGFVARKLGLADADPQGVLMVGANPFTMALGQALTEKGFRVVLIDTNWDNVRRARLRGLVAVHGNVLSESVVEELDLAGIGKVFAATPNNNVNSLSLIHLSPHFTSERSYQLCNPDKGSSGQGLSEGLINRRLFGEDLGYSALDALIQQGAEVKATTLSDEFNEADFKAMYGSDAAVLMVMSEGGRLEPVTVDFKPKLKAGSTPIFLLKEPESVSFGEA